MHVELLPPLRLRRRHGLDAEVEAWINRNFPLVGVLLKVLPDGLQVLEIRRPVVEKRQRIAHLLASTIAVAFVLVFRNKYQREFDIAVWRYIVRRLASKYDDVLILFSEILEYLVEVVIRPRNC